MKEQGDLNNELSDQSRGVAQNKEIGDVINGAPSSKTAGAAGLQTGSNPDLCPKTNTETGLPFIQTWNTAYIFVACTFCLWLALLICLTEMSA